MSTTSLSDLLYVLISTHWLTDFAAANAFQAVIKVVDVATFFSHSV